LLQKISSLAQLLPFQSLPKIMDPALSFVDPLKFLILLKAYESFSPKDRAYLISVQSSHEPESFAAKIGLVSRCRIYAESPFGRSHFGQVSYKETPESQKY
ncbi:hypothetical protein FXO38_18035, partial [Capsicum annuum]